METINADDIDIEEIMRSIREEILAQRQGVDAVVNIDGQRFPPEFYEHLYQAALSYDEGAIEMTLTPINVPLIGPLLQTIRQKLHELVLFYVNQSVDKQRQVNKHLLRAIDVLAQELERQER